MTDLDPRPYYSLHQKVLACKIPVDGAPINLDLTSDEYKELVKILFSPDDVYSSSTINSTEK